MEKGLALEGVTGVRYMYHDPCHSPDEDLRPLEVTRKLTGQAVPLNDRCCGESGTFAATRPTSRPRCATARRRRW
jgi:Fe-S oxidoreductase